MNELNLYDLFRQILSKSKVIQGRFHVSTNNSGNDLNTENLNEVVKDALGSITSIRKYPLCVLMPPVEELDNYIDGDYSNLTLTVYFLTQAFNGSSGIKKTNVFNNTSDHSTILDWKDMRECAVNFRKAFVQVTQANGNIIRDGQKKDLIVKISNIGNDNLNGVKLVFDVQIFSECVLNDYELESLKNIKINNKDLHPLHQH